MGKKTQITKDRTALHTGIYLVTGDLQPGYESLDAFVSAPNVTVREAGFDERVSGPAGLNAEKLLGEHGGAPVVAVAMRDDGVALANEINERAAPAGLQRFAKKRDVYDKQEVYELAKGAGVAVPRYEVAANDEELIGVLGSGRFSRGKTLIKPSMGTNAAGVYRLTEDESPAEAVRAYRQVLGQEELLRGGADTLIMEYIDWDDVPVEISVEGVLSGGAVAFLATHEKLDQTAVAPFRVSRMVTPPVTPAIIDRAEEIRETVENTASALGLEDGVFHLEFRLTRDDVVLVDVALRPGAGFVSHSVHCVYGVDLRLLHFASHFGPLDPINSRKLERGACIGALYASPRTEVSPAMLRSVEKYLDDERVFASNVRSSLVEDPLWKSDVQVSVGVSGDSAADAVAWFKDFATEFLLE